MLEGQRLHPFHRMRWTRAPRLRFRNSLDLSVVPPFMPRRQAIEERPCLAPGRQEPIQQRQKTRPVHRVEQMAHLVHDDVFEARLGLLGEFGVQAKGAGVESAQPGASVSAAAWLGSSTYAQRAAHRRRMQRSLVVSEVVSRFGKRLLPLKGKRLMVPAVRIERTTFRLQGGCSTS